MAPESILDLLQAELPGDGIEPHAAGAHPHAVVAAERWHDVARFVRDDERLGLDWLRCITGVDHIEDGQLTVIYDLHATLPAERDTETWRVRNEIAIKIHVDRDDPRIPSVVDVWPAANWHERETYDLLGVIFEGHPELRRILCCDDWVGHPLRRDYEFPTEYHGIPAVIDYDPTKPQP